MEHTDTPYVATDAEINAIFDWIFTPSSAPPAKKTISLLGADLRRPCTGAPDAGMHKHVCQCGTAWQHDEDLPRAANITHEAFEEAHTCPACGEKEYWKAEVDHV